MIAVPISIEAKWVKEEAVKMEVCKNCERELFGWLWRFFVGVAGNEMQPTPVVICEECHDRN